MVLAALRGLRRLRYKLAIVDRSRNDVAPQPSHEASREL
jgi:hypothetical protein